jgi:hypothetical protein
MASKAKLVAVPRFDLTSTCEVIAESILTLQSAETAKAILNGALKDALTAKVQWKEIKPELAEAFTVRGVIPQAVYNATSAVKWCFENGVQVDTLNLTRMKDKGARGATLDLVTGKAKAVKATAKAKAKAKSEAVVDHCGIGMAKAMTQEGFIKFLNTLVWDLGELETAFADLMDDGKLDFVRSALEDCGYMVRDGAEWKVAVIKESDDEVGE